MYPIPSIRNTQQKRQTRHTSYEIPFANQRNYQSTHGSVSTLLHLFLNPTPQFHKRLMIITDKIRASNLSLISVKSINHFPSTKTRHIAIGRSYSDSLSNSINTPSASCFTLSASRRRCLFISSSLKLKASTFCFRSVHWVFRPRPCSSRSA